MGRRRAGESCHSDKRGESKFHKRVRAMVRAAFAHIEGASPDRSCDVDCAHDAVVRDAEGRVPRHAESTGEGGRVTPVELTGADLHVHSNVSDGTDPPERVVERAREAGLASFALTDHDTTDGLERAIAAGRRLGVEVIAGIEMSAEYGGREVHLLGFFFDPADRELAGTLRSLQAERIGRVGRIVSRLNELGLPVAIEEVRARSHGASIGRPHIADALVEGGHVASHEVAWKEYLGAGGKAYVERVRPSLREAATMIRRAGGVTSIAHPTLNLQLQETGEVAASAGVDAIETAHPKLTASEAAALAEICRRGGLRETGGSDCHGSRRGGPYLGAIRLSREALDRLRPG